MQLACDVLESTGFGVVSAFRDEVARRWLALPVAINLLCGIAWFIVPWQERAPDWSHAPTGTFTLHMPGERFWSPCDTEPVPSLAIHTSVDEIELEMTASRLSAASGSPVVIFPDGNVTMADLVQTVDEIHARQNEHTMVVLRFPGQPERPKPVKVRAR